MIFIDRSIERIIAKLYQGGLYVRVVLQPFSLTSISTVERFASVRG